MAGYSAVENSYAVEIEVRNNGEGDAIIFSFGEPFFTPWSGYPEDVKLQRISDQNCLIKPGDKANFKMFALSPQWIAELMIEVELKDKSSQNIHFDLWRGLSEENRPDLSREDDS